MKIIRTAFRLAGKKSRNARDESQALWGGQRSAWEFPGSEYSREEVEFMMAMDRYKRKAHSPFPTWPEVLAVVKSLGYRKVV